jgi:hypothetical protein
MQIVFEARSTKINDAGVLNAQLINWFSHLQGVFFYPNRFGCPHLNASRETLGRALSTETQTTIFPLIIHCLQSSALFKRSKVKFSVSVFFS